MKVRGSKEIGEFQRGQILGWYQCGKSEKLLGFTRLIIKGLIILLINLMKKDIVVWNNVQEDQVSWLS